MNELEFLRGMEGEEQQGEDLVAAAEHFVRLKQQTGQQQNQYPDLELEKRASNPLFGVAGVSREVIPAVRQREKDACATCGKSKTACMCGTKMAAQKQAAAEALKKALINAITRVDPPLFATTALGAAAGGLGTYLGSRPQKDTGKSKIEEEMNGRVAANDAAPKRGLLDKMHGADLQHAKGYAEAFREHPRKAALIGAGVGAGGGYLLGRIGGAAIQHFKKG